MEIALLKKLVFILRFLEEGNGVGGWGKQISLYNVSEVMLPGHGSKFSKEGECGVKDEAPISGLWVNGRMNTWLAASHSLRRALPDNPPYSCLSATPAPRPHSPHSSDAKSPFQVSWACLVGLLHYMLNHLNGRGGNHLSLSSNPRPRPFFLKAWLSHLQFWKHLQGLASSTLSEMLCSCQMLWYMGQCW